MDNIWTNDYNPFQGWKVLAWYDRMKAIKTGNFKPPVNIALDPIQGTPDKKRCGGLSCNFCMSNLDGCEPAEIPHGIFLELPEFFSEWGVKSLCIAGHNSDPAMYNQDVMGEFLKRCHFNGLDVGFVSNGVRYGDDLIKSVASYCRWSGWSVNAGLPETYEKITGVDAFWTVLDNMSKCSEHGSRCGYKFLVTDDNYKEIASACAMARNYGATHFQVRPCELPKERSDKIDVKEVASQMKGCIKLQRDGFGVFGIGEKFTKTLSKKTPKRCIASPLGSTWMADGRVVICPDRRWDDGIWNFLSVGTGTVKREWGHLWHKAFIDRVDTEACIRCTSYRWHEIYENTVEEDNLDITLI